MTQANASGKNPDCGAFDGNWLTVAEFGYEKDGFDIGAFGAEPDIGKGRDEYGVELFWRLRLTNSVQFTPDVQFWRLSGRDEEEIEAVVTFRLTISIRSITDRQVETPAKLAFGE